MAHEPLPLPEHFDPDRVGEVWRVPYGERAREALAWAARHDVRPAAEDRFRICLLAVDVQNTFCVPEFELYVGGRSGHGAVDDNRRLCRFLYANLPWITRIAPTLDTHQAVQIFHATFLVGADGRHPDPFTQVSERDLRDGVWRFDAAVCDALGIDADYGRRHLESYARRLREGGKYELTIWPFHAMLGGIGHALASAVEEAIFFHGIARRTQASFVTKGSDPLTEHYSALSPEVLEGPDGHSVGRRNTDLVERLLTFDAVVVAGQAKSHCVAWTVADLLETVEEQDPALAGKLYLLEDCTSSVVIPGVVDYTDEADAAFARFADAGMHLVRSTEPLARWPGIDTEKLHATASPRG